MNNQKQNLLYTESLSSKLSFIESAYRTQLLDYVDVIFIFLHFLPKSNSLFNLSWIYIFRPSSFNVVYPSTFRFKAFCVHFMFRHFLRTLDSGIARITFDIVSCKLLVRRNINMKLCLTISKVTLTTKFISFLRINIHNLHVSYFYCSLSTKRKQVVIILLRYAFVVHLITATNRKLPLAQMKPVVLREETFESKIF